MTTASGALLQIKLFAPRVTRELVDRPRLTDLLGDQLGGEAWPPVLLVSAPAGFGKSTLLAQALLSGSAPGKARVAWLSLDPGDNDPSTSGRTCSQPFAQYCRRSADPHRCSWSRPEARRSRPS